MIFKIIYYKTIPKDHLEDARVHCVVLKVRAVLPHHQPKPAPGKPREFQTPHPHPTRAADATSGPSGPNSVQAPRSPTPTLQPHPEGCGVLVGTSCADAMSNVPPMSPSHTHPAWYWVLEPRKVQVLLRKEVIQPHLPVRLPCYDLVLITDPTFDGSLHKGWATGFRCYRLS